MKRNNLRHKCLLTMAGMWCTALWGQAQITGVVKSEQGEPVLNASVKWNGTQPGTLTDAGGNFELTRPDSTGFLVISCVGFLNDTLSITPLTTFPLAVILKERSITAVTVSARRLGQFQTRGVLNETHISATELMKAACCNLGESFSTNPSVDVSYADAATGARQIKLLGLSGSYVQMLTENIPNYRGLAMPYALGYVPGPWMESIQVSKGCATVKNGYESITGQINIEFLKPQAAEAIHANLYGDSESRIEANADANLHLDKRWSTGLLLHYEDRLEQHDNNHDGFLDKPRIRQFNLQNRWMWKGDNYLFQASLKGMKETRRSGQTTHGMPMEASGGNGLFAIDLETERYEAFTKNAYIFNAEKHTNAALILSGTYHRNDALYGRKT